MLGHHLFTYSFGCRGDYMMLFCFFGWCNQQSEEVGPLDYHFAAEYQYCKDIISNTDLFENLLEEIYEK